MPSILEHPQAQELLAAATSTPAQVHACTARLHAFLQPYPALLPRSAHRAHATLVRHGKRSGLGRTTAAPIAHQAGVPRTPVQGFVGAGAWDAAALRAELRARVARAWADPAGVLVIDPRSFPQKGVASCGVQRQWCGRLGKVENCQVGVCLFYAGRHGHAPLDRQLWLSQEWAGDDGRRAATHVPAAVAQQERWQIALDMVDRASGVPHGWSAAASAFGRVAAFRAALRQRRERYPVDVLDNTLMRDLDQVVPQPARRHGSPKKAAWEGVRAWAARQPAERRQRFEVRAGEKGPLVVAAVAVRVQTRQDNRVGPQERLLVPRTAAADPEYRYRLRNAGAEVPLRELVRAGAARHRAAPVLQEGKGEVGLGQYEVRSWVGRHHHRTLALLALWFLALERGRVGGEKDAADGGAVAAGVHAAAAAAGAERGADRRRGQPRAAA